MLTVEYPPGGSDPVHRHYADTFVYVVEGYFHLLTILCRCLLRLYRQVVRRDTCA